METLSLAPQASEQNHCRSLLDCALEYAKRGWFVFPLHTPTASGCSCGKDACKSIGKHPRTASGVKDATTDKDMICFWWRKWPAANIGIATGERSGIVVLDVDGEIGRASLAALGNLPQTKCASTGRGDHFYYTYPKGVSLKNSQGLLGKDLDIRGEGGYVVAPPSRHAKGSLYSWVEDQWVIANLPACIIRYPRSVGVGPPVSPLRPTHKSKLFPGQRNPYLYKCAIKLRRQGASGDELDRWLRAENLWVCDPPKENQHIVDLAARVASYDLSGPDTLERAWRRVELEERHNHWANFRSLIRHLHNVCAGRPILLPTERLAELMGCHRTYIGDLRRKALGLRLIEEVEPYVCKKKATQFRVLDVR